MVVADRYLRNLWNRVEMSLKLTRGKFDAFQDFTVTKYLKPSHFWDANSHSASQ
jgi:hypothetical protein